MNRRRPRVLVVDDSVVVRSIVGSLIDDSGDFELVGKAANGSIALQLVEQHAPDAVILDVEMPGMDGLEVLREIKARHPATVVIMFSHRTEIGARVTLDALEIGAADYVTKPSGFSDREAALDDVRSQLLPRLRALSGLVQPVRPGLPRSLAGPRVPISVVVIASSTGGPAALMEVIPALHGGLPVPVVLVQHMPAVFTAQLAERLDAVSALSVREATTGDAVRAGEVLVAPGGHHLLFTGSPDAAEVLTYEGERVNGVIPAADVTLASAVQVFAGGVLSVVLTGMGYDGLAGSIGAFEAGGRVLAQDEPSSVVWGMPGAVAQAGIADQTLPLDRLAAAVTKLCGGSA